ncbi:hypothetical protein PSA5_26995, partial [Pseudomonas syringae pv. actinidiae]
QARTRRRNGLIQRDDLFVCRFQLTGDDYRASEY